MARAYPDGPYDVVVVGAGVIGLATAWQLRRAGARTAVIDPDPVSGATHAAAGMLAPVSEVQHQQDPLVPLMVASAREYPQLIGPLEDVTGPGTAGYRCTETLVCGIDAADRQALSDLHRLQLGHGLEIERITSREARRLEPALSPRLSSVLRIPGDRQIDPRSLSAALLEALTSTSSAVSGPAGVVVRHRAAGLIRHGDGPVTGVRLASGQEILAAETVVAAGTAAGSLENMPIRLPIRPVHGDVLRTVPAGTEAAGGPLLERTVRAVVRGFPVYLVPRTDGSLVIGATSREDGLERPSAGGVYQLLRDAQVVVPGILDLELAEVTARARPGTPDDMPYLGRLRHADGDEIPGLVVSAGHFRHGILLAALAARLTAALITDPGSLTAEDGSHLASVDPHRGQPIEHSAGPHVLERRRNQ